MQPLCVWGQNEWCVHICRYKGPGLISFGDEIILLYITLCNHGARCTSIWLCGCFTVTYRLRGNARDSPGSRRTLNPNMYDRRRKFKNVRTHSSLPSLGPYLKG